MLVSTAVFTKSNSMDIANTNLAYLLACRELNNDPTDYWMFTPQSLRLVLKRSGWNVLDEFLVDDSVFNAHRMYCYCERVPAWRDLRMHHDF
jgi:hypothetical protein